MRFLWDETTTSWQNARPYVRAFVLVSVLEAALVPVLNRCLAQGVWSVYLSGAWSGSVLVGLVALVRLARRRLVSFLMVSGSSILFVGVTLSYRPLLFPCIRHCLPFAIALEITVFCSGAHDCVQMENSACSGNGNGSDLLVLIPGRTSSAEGNPYTEDNVQVARVANGRHDPGSRRPGRERGAARRNSAR